MSRFINHNHLNFLFSILFICFIGFITSTNTEKLESNQSNSNIHKKNQQNSSTLKGILDNITIRSKMSFPSLFVSHGSPMLLISKNNFVKNLWTDLPRHLPSRPKAIVIFSAHYITTGNEIRIAYRDSEYKLNYDFYGFPDELYKVQYHAKGSKTLAEKIKLLAEENLGKSVRVSLDPQYNIDHGAFVPLIQLTGTTTDIPVVVISTNMQLPPQTLMDFGKAIAPLRNEEILIVGSGSEVHNIPDFFQGEVFSEVMPISSKSLAFGNALRNAIQGEKNYDDLRPIFNSYRQTFPQATSQHPSDDHFRPFLYALGAGINLNSNTVKSQYIWHKSKPTGTILFGVEREIHVEL